MTLIGFLRLSLPGVSNWCPGDVIDIRRIEWGTVPAGAHEFVIEVPEAEFVGDDGNFPLSVFLVARETTAP